MLGKNGIYYDDEVHRLVKSFSTCFNMRFSISSSENECYIYGVPHTRFCTCIREDLCLFPQCINLDRSAARRSGKMDRPLVYFCHAGLCEAVMPIKIDANCIGYAQIGQFRSGSAGRDELGIPPGIIAQCEKAGVNKKDVKEAWLELPYYDETFTKNIIDLFFVLVNFIVMQKFINIRRPDLVEKISQWLEGHLAEPFSLDELADDIGRCRSTIQHTIKKYYNMSFKQLCILKRIRRFETLVSTEPSLSVSEAVYRTGYEDPLYFSRLYKKNRHITPSAYAKSVREQLKVLPPPT
ncbi:MAG: PocR ligand-binding domain-containing protein [Treponema sp.]|nr:PocR ligand-binding domain-containing protein [Treponema sp.]